MGNGIKPLFLTAWEREDYERQKRGEKPLGPFGTGLNVSVCPVCGEDHPPDMDLGNGNVVDYPCENNRGGR